MIDFQELKAAARIDDLVRLYGGEINRAGMTRCVLHSERTPSMKVDTEKGVFHCFGCGAGGDIIRLAQLKEGLDAVAAARFIDSALGLNLDKNVPPKERFESMKRAKIRQFKARQERRRRDMENRLYTDLCGKLHELSALKAEQDPMSDEWAKTVMNLDKVRFLIELIEQNNQEDTK